MAFNFSVLGKFLSIGLAALSAVSPLEAEWGSGAHLQTVQDSIQVAAQLASAATSDTNTQAEIAAAAGAVPGIVTAVAELIKGIKKS